MVIEWDDRPDHLLDELIAVAPDHGVPEWSREDEHGPCEWYCDGGELLVLFKDMPLDATLPTFTVEHWIGPDRKGRERHHDVTWTPSEVVSSKGTETVYRFEASE